VFIATDAILHAWHRSYDMMLVELEETYLFENVRQIIEGMASKVQDAAAQAGDGPLKDSVWDADYFLTVARSLLAGGKQPSSLSRRACGARSKQSPVCNWTTVSICSANRARWISLVQCADITPSRAAGRYFQCVMWLGRTDLRGGGRSPSRTLFLPPHAPPRQLGAALVLHQLLKDSGQFERRQQFDAVQTFVG
jgi:hypothetical protein